MQSESQHKCNIFLKEHTIMLADTLGNQKLALRSLTFIPGIADRHFVFRLPSLNISKG